MLLKIAELRKARSKTQIELAIACGVNQKAVSQWEKGQCFPSCDKLPKIADLLNCSIDALFGRENTDAG